LWCVSCTNTTTQIGVESKTQPDVESTTTSELASTTSTFIPVSDLTIVDGDMLITSDQSSVSPTIGDITHAKQLGDESSTEATITTNKDDDYRRTMTTRSVDESTGRSISNVWVAIALLWLQMHVMD
jgi:hypothetical protein